MGQFFDKDTFTPSDHDEFRRRVRTQLEELRSVLAQADFSSSPASLGAELELYIIDKHGLPAPKNTALLNALNNPLLCEELNKFNLEFNLSPVEAKGRPFSKMTEELSPFLQALRKAANVIDSDIVSIGILPTLSSAHLHRDYMTDLPRYRALTKELSSLKGEPFVVDINGKDALKMHCDEVTLEGANTSFQVHLKVPAKDFANLFNAAQLTTPLVLAMSANSPTFLGERLWQETRIALFKQSIDNRIHALTNWRQPARVSFGHGWVREGAWEIFAENVGLYRPILPYLSPDNEAFAELNLHHGTIWSWNRPVFEPKHGGHLRIEYRSLPAGPTLIDMMANAALAIGWTKAMSDAMPEMIPKIPFNYAEYNFYRAAQDGLDAKILWPRPQQHGLKEQYISDVIKEILPQALEGLLALGIDSEEAQTLMGVIEQRLSTRQTAAAWQLACLNKYSAKYDRGGALQHLLKDYMQNSNTGEPVSTWKV